MQKDYFKVGDKVFIIRELDEKRYADAQNGPGMMPRMKQWVNNFDLNLTVSHVGENHKDWLTVDNGEGESWTFNANDVAFAASRELGVGGKAIVFRKVCQYAGYPKASWPGDDHMIGQQINIKEVYNPTNLWEKHLRDVGGGYFDWRSLAPVRDDGVKEKKKKKEEVPTAPKEKPPLHELLNKGSGSGSCCSFAIRFEKDDYVPHSNETITIQRGMSSKLLKAFPTILRI